ncbi:hypothetical protein [Magnetospirillum sp. SS-4]|nr:hypothetical protein [Magnetospirillum sp. SS-4]CAA7620292.1 exported hypothetical protein [Magnetospirillum sp. SS-4]
MFGRMILQGVVATLIVAALSSVYAASAQHPPTFQERSAGHHGEDRR